MIQVVECRQNEKRVYIASSAAFVTVSEWPAVSSDVYMYTWSGVPGISHTDAMLITRAVRSAFAWVLLEDLKIDDDILNVWMWPSMAVYTKRLKGSLSDL